MAAPHFPPHVCVCICTYRRNEPLERLLLAIGRLTFPSGLEPDLRVHVVDNNPDGSAGTVVERLAPQLPFPVGYQQVGQQNISAVRNAALEGAPADADLLALIDDDEEPSPEWLDHLLVVQRECDADVVIGPVVPAFSADAPAWIRDGGFFDLAQHPDRTRLDDGISGNALLRRSAVSLRGLRFDERLGLSGGEDQAFFRSVAASGLDIRYAADALVTEPVPQARLSVRYLLERERRKGNTLGLLDRGLDRRTPRPAAIRLLKSAKYLAHGVGGLLLLPVTRSRASLVWSLCRVARGAGMLTGLGGRSFDQYKIQNARATGH